MVNGVFTVLQTVQAREINHILRDIYNIGISRNYSGIYTVIPYIPVGGKPHAAPRPMGLSTAVEYLAQSDVFIIYQPVITVNHDPQPRPP